MLTALHPPENSPRDRRIREDGLGRLTKAEVWHQWEHPDRLSDANRMVST